MGLVFLINSESLSILQGNFFVADCPVPSVNKGTAVDVKSKCTDGTCPFKAPIAIRCDLGYILIGYGVLFCAENGTWHKPLPRCESKS